MNESCITPVRCTCRFTCWSFCNRLQYQSSLCWTSSDGFQDAYDLPAFAVKRVRRVPAVDRYLLQAPVPSRTPLLLSIDGAHRRTDNRPLHRPIRPCSAYYAGSDNNVSSLLVASWVMLGSSHRSNPRRTPTTYKCSILCLSDAVVNPTTLAVP